MKHFNFDNLGDAQLYFDLLYIYKTPLTVQTNLNLMRE